MKIVSEMTCHVSSATLCSAILSKDLRDLKHVLLNGRLPSLLSLWWGVRKDIQPVQISLEFFMGPSINMGKCKNGC